MTVQRVDDTAAERAKVLRRLLDFGFSDEQAWALATSSPNTVFLVPAGGDR